jgi:hypothetical protein
MSTPMRRTRIDLLGARRKRPRGCRAAERGYEFSSSDVACHEPRGL